MRVSVLYESMTGNTAKVGEAIAEAAAGAGADVSLANVARPDLTALAAADLLVLGSWVDGFIVAGHRPGGAARLRQMPVIDRKPTALFMTYALHAGKALDGFGRVARERGADVMGGRLFKRGSLTDGVDDFVLAALERAPSATG